MVLTIWGISTTGCIYGPQLLTKLKAKLVLGFSIFLVSKNLWFAKKIIQKFQKSKLIFLVFKINFPPRTEILDFTFLHYFGQGLFLKNSRRKVFNSAYRMMKCCYNVSLRSDKTSIPLFSFITVKFVGRIKLSVFLKVKK